MNKHIITAALAISLTTGLALGCEKKPETGKIDTQVDGTAAQVEDFIANGTTPSLNDTTKEDTSVYFVYSTANDGSTNIRKEPSSSSTVIGKLYTNGDGVKLMDSSGSWWKVEVNGNVGYVNSNYVTRRHPTLNEAPANTEFVELVPKPIEEEENDSTEPAANEKPAQEATYNKESKDKKTTSTNNPNNLSQKKPDKRVYYVVVSSWLDFEKAKNSYGKIPDSLEGPIYKATSNGKTVYRMCCSCFSNKAAAETKKAEIEKFYDKGIWVWESQGLGECVYTSRNAKGDIMKPLTPR